MTACVYGNEIEANGQVTCNKDTYFGEGRKNMHWIKSAS